MFLYDGLEVSNKKTQKDLFHDEIYAWIHKQMMELKEKYRFPLQIKYTPKYATPDPKNPRVRKGGVGIPVIEKIKGHDGMEHMIQYYETVTTSRVHNEIIKDYTLNDGRKKIDFKGWMSIPVEKLELAFFLARCSTLKDNYYLIENKVEEAKDTYEKRKRERDMSKWIYDDLDKDGAIIVARAYDVSDIDDKSEEEIKNALYDRALAVGYETFRQQRTVNDVTTKRSVIKKALEKCVITCDDMPEEKTYYLMSKDGTQEKKIKKAARTLNAIDVLYDYFSDEDNYNDLVKRLG